MNDMKIYNKVHQKEKKVLLIEIGRKRHANLEIFVRNEKKIYCI